MKDKKELVELMVRKILAERYGEIEVDKEKLWVAISIALLIIEYRFNYYPEGDNKAEFDNIYRGLIYLL